MPRIYDHEDVYAEAWSEPHDGEAPADAVDPDDPDDLASLTKAQLEELAADEDVDLTGLKTKAEYVDAIYTARETA